MKAKYCSSFMLSQNKEINEINSLYEGLITSYPHDRLLSSLAHKVGSENYKVEFITNFNKSLPYINIIIKNGELEELITDLFRVGGWELADKKIMRETSLVFRAKFDTEIDRKHWPDFVYHITPSENIKKIKEKGLIPRAYNKKLKHEDAIYFYNSNNIEDWRFIATILYTGTNYREFAVLKIDLRDKNVNSPILKNRRFRLYADPDMKNAFFTKENISPKDIEVEEIIRI